VDAAVRYTNTHCRLARTPNLISGTSKQLFPLVLKSCRRDADHPSPTTYRSGGLFLGKIMPPRSGCSCRSSFAPILHRRAGTKVNVLVEKI
jgi:hypothetical protein